MAINTQTYLTLSSTYEEYILSKTDLSSFLLSQLPSDKVHLNKRVLSFDYDDHNMVVRCSDGSVLQGDLLVGADGTHSVVREHLYKILRARGVLPAADEKPMPYSSVALTGETEVLSVDEFPKLKERVSQFASVLGSENMCTVRVIAMLGLVHLGCILHWTKKTGVCLLFVF